MTELSLHIAPNLRLRGVAGSKLLEARGFLVVEDRTHTAPPGSPVNEAAYIVASPATGDFATHEGDVAIYNTVQVAFAFLAPVEGDTVYVKDEDTHYTYTGAAWTISNADAVADAVQVASDAAAAALTAAAAVQTNLDTHDGAGGAVHAVATTSTAGFMSAQDKIDLAAATIVSAPTRANKNMPALVTTADFDLACEAALAFTPTAGSYVSVFVNGLMISYDGTRSSSCYFSDDDGATAHELSECAAGDKLYWVGSVADYELDTDDIIEFAYNAPSSRFLNLLELQTSFAGWTGGLLRDDYTGPIGIISRDDDDAEITVYAVGGVTNAAAIIAHCTGDVGRWKTLCDQGLTGYDITQATPSLRPIVYSETPLGIVGEGVTHTGGLVLGANGYLAAYFTQTEGMCLKRADTLGIVGDVAITMAGDVSFPTNAAADGFMLAIYPDNPNTAKAGFNVYAYNALVDPGQPYMWSDYGRSGDANTFSLDQVENYSMAYRVDRAASAAIGDVRFFHNGVLSVAEDGNEEPGPTVIPASGASFRWGNFADDQGNEAWMLGLMSVAVVAQGVMGNGDAAAFDTFIEAARA